MPKKLTFGIAQRNQWVNVLTKPLIGQTFRDKRAFLQNCATDYDDDFEQQSDTSMNPMNQQAHAVASSRECVRTQTKTPTKPRRQPTNDKSKICVSHLNSNLLNVLLSCSTFGGNTYMRDE